MAEFAHTNRHHLSMGKSSFLINLSEPMFLLDPRDNQFNKGISISADYPMPGFFLINNLLLGTRWQSEGFVLQVLCHAFFRFNILGGTSIEGDFIVIITWQEALHGQIQ